jgi:hypothetical protein
MRPAGLVRMGLRGTWGPGAEPLVVVLAAA